MLQESPLPDELTPTEFLRLCHRMAGGGALRHRPVREQLARVNLAHRRDVRIGRLSGGERRRLDLAVALSADPELSLLDEPTAGLDHRVPRDRWELIRGLPRTGTTMVPGPPAALGIALDDMPAQPLWLVAAGVVVLPIIAAVLGGAMWATFVPLGEITWRMRVTGGGALTELVRIGWQGPAAGGGPAAGLTAPGPACSS